MNNTYDNRINKIMLLAVIALGVILRITLRTSTSLWEDEIIAVTHATTPSLLGVITHTIFCDIHPPLYFLELHVWSYFGQSDSWLIANSIVLGIAAIASIYYVVRRLSDARRALIVTAVFSALPVTIWMSTEVRMYAMLSVLFIWLYYFTVKAFALPKTSAGPRLAVMMLSAIIIYTHAIGFVAVFFYAVYAASWLVTRHATRHDWLLWLGVFGFAGALALPMLFVATFRHADMAPVQGLSDISSWIASVVTGNGYKDLPWLRIAGLITYLAVVLAGTATSRTRRITLCFLVAPILLCLIVDVTVEPLFKTNFFSNFFSPFLALVIGDLIMILPLNKTARAAVLIGVLTGLLTMAIANRLAMNAENTYFLQAAKIIAAEEQPGDVVLVPQPSMFWGMAWYLAGPDWGLPRAIGAPSRPQSRMWKVYDMLGPPLVKTLGLFQPSQPVTTKDGMPLLNDQTLQPRAEHAKRLWMVTRPGGDLPAELAGDNVGSFRRSRVFQFPPIELDLYEQPSRN